MKLSFSNWFKFYAFAFQGLFISTNNSDTSLSVVGKADHSCKNLVKFCEI